MLALLIKCVCFNAVPFGALKKSALKVNLFPEASQSMPYSLPVLFHHFSPSNTSKRKTECRAYLKDTAILMYQHLPGEYSVPAITSLQSFNNEGLLSGDELGNLNYFPHATNNHAAGSRSSNEQPSRGQSLVCNLGSGIFDLQCDGDKMVAALVGFNRIFTMNLSSGLTTGPGQLLPIASDATIKTIRIAGNLVWCGKVSGEESIAAYDLRSGQQSFCIPQAHYTGAPKQGTPNGKKKAAHVTSVSQVELDGKRPWLVYSIGMPACDVVRVWDVRYAVGRRSNPIPLETFEYATEGRALNSIGVHDNFLYASCMNGRVYARPTVNSMPEPRVIMEHLPIKSFHIRLNAIGGKVAIGGTDGSTQVVEVNERNLEVNRRWTLPFPEAQAWETTRLAWSDNALVSACDGGYLHWWSLKESKGIEPTTNYVMHMKSDLPMTARDNFDTEEFERVDIDSLPSHPYMPTRNTGKEEKEEEGKLLSSSTSEFGTPIKFTAFKKNKTFIQQASCPPITKAALMPSATTTAESSPITSFFANKRLKS